jgi:hypothetical protein
MVGIFGTAAMASVDSSACASKPKGRVAVEHFADHYRGAAPGIRCDLADRRLEGLGHDVDAGFRVCILDLQPAMLLEARRRATRPPGTATGDRQLTARPC